MRKQTALWTTRDGQRMRICDMSDTHLMNALRCVERSYRSICQSMADQADSAYGPDGPDGAYFAAQSEANHFYSEAETLAGIDAEIPLHAKLSAEAVRRGLINAPEREELSELEQEAILSAFGEPEWWK